MVCEKHGSKNVHKFVEKRHLTSSWKYQYQNLAFFLPSPNDFDAVMIIENIAVVSGDNMNIPESILPPRDRRVTVTGKLRNGWYERVPAAPNRQCCICSLCHLEGHNRDNCPILQMFGNYDSLCPPFFNF